MLCALVCASLGLAEGAAAESGRVARLEAQAVQQWLIPIVRNGPNNQKRDYRNFIAMAKKFDAGIVLTGVYKHYRERLKRFQLDVSNVADTHLVQQPVCFPETKSDEWGFMDVEDVLDRDHIDQWVPTATVPELMAQGWNGELEAIVYPEGDPNMLEVSGRYVARTLNAVKITIGPDTVHVQTPLTLRCNGAIMKELRTALRPFNYVGVMQTWMGHHIVPNLMTETVEPPKEGTCRHAVFYANRMLRRAPWIREIGRKFVERHMGGQPFLSVHIRPYADSCLDEWRRVNSSNVSGLNASLCFKEHADLHLRVGKCIARIMSSDNLGKVFIMAHPAIQYMVGQLLAKEGVPEAAMVHLGFAELLELAQCSDTSTTFMSMVEEEIASQAATFVGTSWSSITHSIAYERLGRNVTDNWYWEALTQCGLDPVEGPSGQAPADHPIASPSSSAIDAAIAENTAMTRTVSQATASDDEGAVGADELVVEPDDDDGGQWATQVAPGVNVVVSVRSEEVVTKPRESVSEDDDPFRAHGLAPGAEQDDYAGAAEGVLVRPTDEFFKRQLRVRRRVRRALHS